MDHPGIDITQIKKDMTLEEIQEKIIQLRNRMGFAYSMGKHDMMNQLEMVLEVYTRAQTEILTDMFTDDGDGPDLSGKIDVS